MLSIAPIDESDKMRRMEFRQLKTFDVVAMFMNFNRAAEVLHLSQSTVSAQIKALEDDIGAAVFERLGRRIVLTPVGEELRRHTRRLLSYEQELQASLRKQGETVGLITLRVPQSVADTHLPHIIRRFIDAFPRVGFDVSNCGYYHLVDELRSGEIDAAFLFTSRVDSTELTAELMVSEPMVYVASPTSGLATRSQLSIKDLANQTLLLPKHDCGYRMQLEQTLTESGVSASSIIELNSLSSLVQCLTLGIGVALLPRCAVAREIAERKLTVLDWSEPLATELYLLRHRDRSLSGILGAFINTVGDYFSERRAEKHCH